MRRQSKPKPEALLLRVVRVAEILAKGKPSASQSKTTRSHVPVDKRETTTPLPRWFDVR